MGGESIKPIRKRIHVYFLMTAYLPKGIDLNQADQHYLNQVAMSLNTRPRKALEWLTPLEKFAQLVDYHKTFQTVAPHV